MLNRKFIVAAVVGVLAFFGILTFALNQNDTPKDQNTDKNTQEEAPSNQEEKEDDKTTDGNDQGNEQLPNPNQPQQQAPQVGREVGNVDEGDKEDEVEEETDKTAPVFAFDHNYDLEQYHRGVVGISVSAQDDESGVDGDSLKYLWSTSPERPSDEDTNWQSFDNGSSILSLPNVSGAYYLHVYAADTNGNARYDRVGPFMLDNDAPKFKGLSYGYHTTGNIKVEVIEDNLKSIAAHKDHSSTAIIIENGDELTEEGTYRLVATDMAGNTTSIYVAIDRTNPAIEGVVDGKHYNTDVHVIVSDKFLKAINVGDTIYNSFGNAKQNGEYWEKELFFSDEGVYTIVAKDKVGNETRVTFTIDKTAPVITLNGNKSVTLETGVDEYNELGTDVVDNFTNKEELTHRVIIEYVQGTKFVKVSSIDNTKSGRYKITYYYKDKAGNESQIVRNVYFKDTIGPEITFVPNGSEVYAKEHETEVNITDISGVDFEESRYMWVQDKEILPSWSDFGGSPLSGNGQKIKTPKDGNGVYYLCVRVKDNSDNFNPTIACSSAFYLDTTPANVTVTYISDKGTSETYVTKKARVAIRFISDEKLSTQNTVVTIAGQVATLESETQKDNGFEYVYKINVDDNTDEGTVEFVINAVDMFGNVTGEIRFNEKNYGSYTAKIIVDRTAPIIKVDGVEKDTVFETVNVSLTPANYDTFMNNPFVVTDNIGTLLPSKITVKYAPTWDGNENTYSGTGVDIINLMIPGVYKIEYLYQDQAGNTATAKVWLSVVVPENTVYIYNETQQKGYNNLDDAINSANAGDVLKLFTDIQFTSTFEIVNKTLTLNLNGHRLSTPDANGMAAKSVLSINGSSNITIIGPGTIQAGNAINALSNDFMNATVKVTGESSLTVKDDVTIKGSNSINSREATPAILLWRGNSLTVDNSTIIGGDNIKDITYPLYSYDGQAGTAIYLYQSNNVTVNISNSTVQGGSGINQGYDVNYIPNGANQAAGGFAIDSLNSTFSCNIINSTINGGNSDIYNAGTAIKAGAGNFIIRDSAVAGGNALMTGSQNYGIGGDAIEINNNSSNVTIVSSVILGGSGGNSYLGNGIKYNNQYATLHITDSTIYGGGVNGHGNGFGNAIYSNKNIAYDQFQNLTIANTTLSLQAPTSKVYGGYALYTTKSGFNVNDMLDVIVGAGNYTVNAEDGSIFIGSRQSE